MCLLCSLSVGASHDGLGAGAELREEWQGGEARPRPPQILFVYVLLCAEFYLIAVCFFVLQNTKKEKTPNNKKAAPDPMPLPCPCPPGPAPN